MWWWWRYRWWWWRWWWWWCSYSTSWRLHWLPIRTRIVFRIATLTYKSSGQPAYLRELICLCQPSHSLWSSNQLLLTVPLANLTIGQRAFLRKSKFMALKKPGNLGEIADVIWNAIPLSVRDAPYISTFKHRLKLFSYHSFVS